MARDLPSLFGQARKLSGVALKDFLRRLAEDRPETAEELIHLLEVASQDAAPDREPLALSSALDREDDCEQVQRLLSELANHEEYRHDGMIDEGGQGVVVRVWDRKLGRSLAMKAMRRSASRTEGTSSLDAQSLTRFIEEAKVSGRLDHPGIVPIHQLGLDSSSRPFFTMKLVRGETFESAIEKVRRGHPDWSRARALNVLVRVCDAMAYAHEKGILHRDLKPTNIMVGNFGEVYVMDWGLARAMDAEGRERRPAGEVAGEEVSELRKTRHGDVIGTPAYMSPEQARGEVERMCPASDVYSIGAILYCLLTGSPPYSQDLSPSDAVEAVRRGPPESPAAREPDAHPELVSICEKAMDRDPARRFSSAAALGKDISAFLEGRVVSAHDTGAVAELWKWTRRHRFETTTLAGALLVVLFGLLGLALHQRSEHHRKTLDNDFYLADALIGQADELWPAAPGTLPVIVTWLSRAEELEARSEEHRSALRRLQGSGSASRDERERQARLVEDLRRLFEGDDSVFGRVADRRRLAETVEERSVRGPVAHRKWEEAIRSIADRRESPQYDGLRIRPQGGLLPLGKDPGSGLWEFAVVPSGQVIGRDAGTGRLQFDERSAIVLVLLPGGSFLFGAQGTDPGSPGYDPGAIDDEGPPEELFVAPFFLSKFEVTQGQWERIEGSNPSLWRAGSRWAGNEPTAMNPVESISWVEAREFCVKLELDLPTEVQWEYAARAGTKTPWSTGDTEASLEGSANLYDQYAVAQEGEAAMTPVPWSDGFWIHAPVGSFSPNAFGLHDVHGNVWEFCHAHRGMRFLPGSDPGPARDRWVATRGGCCLNRSAHVRSANISLGDRFARSHLCGLRPARALDSGPRAIAEVRNTGR